MGKGGDGVALGPYRAVHIPNGISMNPDVFAQFTAESPYTSQWAAPFRLKIALVHAGSFGPPYSASQMASRSVQPFPQAS